MVRRGYAKLMNDFYINGKIKQLRATCPSAVGAFVLAIAWCSDNLTDGRISDRDLRYVLGVTDEEIDALCGVDLLEPDGNEGYVIHEYTQHNNPKSKVRKKRAYDNRYYAEKRTGNPKKEEIQSTDSDFQLTENEVQSTESDFQSTEDEVQSVKSVCNRTKHKNQNTRTNTYTPYSPPEGGASDDEPEYRQPSSEPTLQFDQLMAIYPNHDNPDDGLRELKRVLHRKSPHTSFAALLAGAQILANEHRDPRYVPTLGNWLRKGGWKNKPRPRTPASSGPVPSRSQLNQDANAALIARYAQEEARQPQGARKEIGS